MLNISWSLISFLFWVKKWCGLKLLFWGGEGVGIKIKFCTCSKVTAELVYSLFTLSMCCRILRQLKSFQQSTLKCRTDIWDNVFKGGPSKICGRQPLKKLNGYGLLKVDHTPSSFLKAVFHKFYLVHSWILCLIYLENTRFSRMR